MPFADKAVATPAGANGHDSGTARLVSSVSHHDWRSPSMTVVVLTLNEELRLPDCLAGIPDRYPVLVLDSGSSDRTLELACERGCAIASNPWPGFAQQRNFALERCGLATDWVLFIDADESYGPEFFDWFDRDGHARDDFDVAFVPSGLVFEGTPLRHAPGYPIYHPRLIRRGHARFVTNHTGHGETVAADARAIWLDVGYQHRLYDDDVTGWMAKHVRLAAQEAWFLAEEGKQFTPRARLSRSLGGSILRVPLRFLYHYVVRAGFRDGRAGLDYALLYAWYEATKWVMRKAGRRAEPG